MLLPCPKVGCPVEQSVEAVAQAGWALRNFEAGAAEGLSDALSARLLWPAHRAIAGYARVKCGW